ncbi:enoyl-CoA hydratase [Myxococcota bacterium]|nr:enoyl-CoA hydratase [Myxococcota bacterium]
MANDDDQDIVLVEIDDRIATVTLNRPERRNALSRALYRRIPAVLAELDERPEVEALILTGSDPAFCAGVDLKELSEPLPPAGPGGRSSWRGPIPPLSTPLIGAINGVAVTGGLEFALACDFLVASERAAFADTHARVGIMPGDGLTVRLAEAVGLRRAKEMSVTGNFVSASEALKIGLVNHVVPHEELLPFTRSLAQDILSNDRRGVIQMLSTYDQVTDTTADEGWQIEDRISRGWQGGDIDPDEIARRRGQIMERGRKQI